MLIFVLRTYYIEQPMTEVFCVHKRKNVSLLNMNTPTEYTKFKTNKELSAHISSVHAIKCLGLCYISEVVLSGQSLDNQD